MTLEDFEKGLTEEKEAERRREKRRDRESHRHSHRHHHHHIRSSQDRGREREDEGHRTKRRRHNDKEENEHQHRHHHESSSQGKDIAADAQLQTTNTESAVRTLKRDSWMEAPSSIEVDYVQRKRKEPSPPKQRSLGADFELKVHERELNHHLRDLQHDKSVDDIEDESSHEPTYIFGDSSSKSRMTRLKAVYREAKESGRSVDDAALDRYDNLREFDDAREEEIELNRRDAYGRDYVGKQKPSGELFRDRTKKNTLQSTPQTYKERTNDVVEGTIVEGVVAPSTSVSGNGSHSFDQTALNRLRAQLMKAQLRRDPKLAEIQKQYDEAVHASSVQDPTIVTLSAMDNRILSSADRQEVKSVQNQRGAERGQVEENDDMTIEDMVREERRTKGQGLGEAKRFAERIAKDGKFDNDLDYMDENAAKLAKRVHKSDLNLRGMAINEYQKLNKILENCPLCHHEDTETLPIAPIVSLGTRTYLTLPTEPELASLGAMVVPIQHRTNLMEADDDEWEEIRNFMKALTRFYHDQGRDVIFYENAAHPHRKPHAALNAIPLPYSQGETAPAFFKEAFLTTEDEWSQHKKIIDTLAKSKQGLGKLAFRRTLVKEMPYFHVWFEMDGGLGHIVENADRWPKGDLFAREIIGGMLGLEPDVIKRQGRWHRGRDTRLDAFQKKWRKFDWTRVLIDE